VSYTDYSIYRRYYIKIDYSKLATLDSNSDTDGHSNTLDIYKKAGTAVSNAFEKTVSSILKTESGHETENAFAIGKGLDINHAPAPTGDFGITSSAAVGECMKKNRYNIKESKSNDDEGAQGLVLSISESDIVWYLPAKDEFSSAPSGVTPSDYWSSTVSTTDSEGNSSTKYAYLGNGNLDLRSTPHSIRARRVPLMLY
jgi:hypothetical protein